ncbi:MepB family protein [Enterococcus plantarum]|uniref:MepB family protein n=1 Tax=Enterococcus TaxID=1350 RepID=UPI001A90794A|nr:MepB family protein [Enterococcus plantarum]MBO0423286.1 MepB family protein [Enterococcus plantarum]
MKENELLETEFGKYAILNYEEQNSEYNGMIIESSSNVKVRCRKAKKTPKKEGYFVAFWEKDKQSKNQPFDFENSPEILAISVVDGDQVGVFVFPKQICVDKGIYSTKRKTGKMAMRFYPTWCLNLNATAVRTQKWQLDYFKDYSE